MFLFSFLHHAGGPKTKSISSLKLNFHIAFGRQPGLALPGTQWQARIGPAWLHRPNRIELAWPGHVPWPGVAAALVVKSKDKSSSKDATYQLAYDTLSLPCVCQAKCITMRRSHLVSIRFPLIWTVQTLDWGRGTQQLSSTNERQHVGAREFALQYIL